MQKKQVNIQDKQVLNTTFVRISNYVRMYFYVKYGSPVNLPYSHPLYQLMSSHLVNNPTLCRISKQSSCHAAIDLYTRSCISDVPEGLSEGESVDELMEVVMPDTIHRSGTSISVGPYFQLDNIGARLFRKSAKSEFWQEMQLFIRQCFIRAANRGEKVSREEAISDFIIAYGIPMSLYENMLRCERRERKRLDEEIENKRDFMERRINDVFIYT